MKPNKSIIIYNIFPISINEVNKEINIPFNKEIMISIMQRKAVAATNASVKEFSIGGFWIITNNDKRVRTENVLYHKKWEKNTPGMAEVIILLELITVLEKKGRHMQSGGIKIGFDNKKGYKK